MATRGRKPTPKTQRELSVEQHKAFDTEVGNPNFANGINRGNQISFTGDSTKPFSIGIQDIDESIMYYFQNVIRPFVIQNGTRIEVPIIYGSPEKWASFQKFGYFRDSQGRIMMPLIMFKRDSIDKVRTIANKLDANNPNLYNSLINQYNKKNFYTPFDVLNNIKLEREQYAVVIPDYVTLTYSCVIYTYYIEQMNKIVEAIEYASDSYWGDPARFKFNARIDSFTTVIEVEDGKDRAVKSTFNIKLNGYIIPDVIQKDVSAVKKIPDITSVTFTTEVVSNINQLPNKTNTN